MAIDPRHRISIGLLPAGILITMLTAMAEPDPVSLPRFQPLPANEASRSIRVKNGFHVELAASEPLVIDPIAISFDEFGRMFVVEMRGYSERRDENLGRIKLLTDEDRDGRYDRATVYVEGLRWPTGITCWNGGVYVIASPHLHFFRDTNNDGIADEKRVVIEGFGNDRNRLNVQALPNSLVWGLDNRIHGATSLNGASLKRPGGDDKPLVLKGSDFSFDPVDIDIRAEAGGGQYGMCFDDAGRKYFCSNSDHLRTVFVSQRYGSVGFGARTASVAADGPTAEVFRISPDEPWRLVRTAWRLAGDVPGPVEGGGRVSGYFTAATGICIYRGDLFPDTFAGNAFVCDAGSNLVHRKKIIQSDGGLPKGVRPPDEQGMEFLACSDTWFRPTQAVNGPDGALYIVDMYREIIEHPWSLPPGIKEQLDLDSGNDRGRIWRVVHDDVDPPRFPQPGEMETAGLVATLYHPNGWHRDTAARLLFARQASEAAPLIRNKLKGGNGVGAAHGLAVLQGLKQLHPDDIVAALRHPLPTVRRRALILAEPFLQDNRIDANQLIPLSSDSDATVRFQLALTLLHGSGRKKNTALLEIIRRDDGSELLRRVVLAGMDSDVDQNTLTSLFENGELVKSVSGRAFVARICRAFTGKEIAWRDLIDNTPVSTPEQRQLAFAVVSNLNSEHLDKAWVNKLLEHARKIFEDKSNSVNVRVEAADFFRLADEQKARAVLAATFSAATPPKLQRAVLDVWKNHASMDTGHAIGRALPGLSPANKSLAARILLGNPDWTPFLLDALEARTLPQSALGPVETGRLFRHKNATVRDRARSILKSKSSASRQEILKRFEAATTKSGDAGRGHTIFLERCAICHVHGEDGQRFGPDVASFRSAGKESILSNIINPNAEVAPLYLAVAITLKDGSTLGGYVLNETDTHLTLQPQGTTPTGIPRADVEKVESLGISSMPEGLEAGLSLQDMADLLVFLTN